MQFIMGENFCYIVFLCTSHLMKIKLKAAGVYNVSCLILIEIFEYFDCTHQLSIPTFTQSNGSSPKGTDVSAGLIGKCSLELLHTDPTKTYVATLNGRLNAGIPHCPRRFPNALASITL